MLSQTTSRPAVILSALLFGLAVLFGCSDTELVAPDRETADDPKRVTAKNGGVTTEVADVFGQGPEGPVVAEDGATIRRTKNGISAKVQMPTPEPGTYMYPTGPKGGAWTDEEGPPEVFTLWVFIFDDPEAEDWTGAFLGGGHVVGGPNLTLSGHISQKTEPFLGEKLSNPGKAAVHLAVAPHGALAPELLPDQIQTPTQPGPDIWWLALFD